MTKFLKEITTKECGIDGREYWPGNIKYNPILMQSIADENTYDCIKQYIINVENKFSTNLTTRLESNYLQDPKGNAKMVYQCEYSINVMSKGSMRVRSILCY